MLSQRQLFFEYMGLPSMQPLGLEISSARGVFLYGPDGKDYIDLVSGVSVSNLGHQHPKIIDAVKDQAEKYMHLMVYGEIIQAPQVQYAEYLTKFLPENLGCCYFVNSGSEAVEGALKLARRYTGRRKIVSFKNSYHGSTLGAMSIMGSEQFRGAFRPLIPDTFQARFNNPDSLGLIDEKTACVIIEPVQGEAGIIFPESGFLEVVREKCTKTKSLLIYDEIQTGFGRLGHMFAIDRFRVIPDILLLAKALGGGMPLGAFLSSGEIMSSLMSDPPLGHITTFGGHPVCCAAGLASMKVLAEERLAETCPAKSMLFRQHLKHDLIREIRGEGLLLAVELTGSEFVRYAVSKAPQYGLVIDYFLFCNNSFRIAPPLIITDEEIVTACNRIKELLDETVNNFTIA